MRKLISFVFPVYNETETLSRLYVEMAKVWRKLEKDYLVEVLFVNDGSEDGSLEKLINMQAKDDRLKVINFSRNFGHQMAITAGLDMAVGDAVIIMDSDLQDPPDVCFKLIDKWEAGYKVVYAQRKTRKDTPFKKITANVFYKALNRLASISIPRDTGDFRLLDRDVVLEVRKFREKNRFMRGLVSYVGFKQTGVLFDRSERYAGITKYPLKKMLRFAADGILSFSTVPLNIISQIGFFVSVVSFLGIVYAFVMKFFFPHITVSGWTLMITAILFIGGVQMLMLGVLGSYVGRIYTEVQQRPLYIISSVYSKPSKEKKNR